MILMPEQSLGQQHYYCLSEHVSGEARIDQDRSQLPMPPTHSYKFSAAVAATPPPPPPPLSQAYGRMACWLWNPKEGDCSYSLGEALNAGAFPRVRILQNGGQRAYGGERNGGKERVLFGGRDQFSRMEILLHKKTLVVMRCALMRFGFASAVDRPCLPLKASSPPAL